MMIESVSMDDGENRITKRVWNETKQPPTERMLRIRAPLRMESESDDQATTSLPLVWVSDGQTPEWQTVINFKPQAELYANEILAHLKFLNSYGNGICGQPNA